MVKVRRVQQVFVGVAQQFWFRVFSFIQSLLEPGSAGAAGEAQHSHSGLQPLHLSRQVSIHAKCHHSVHQQEQDQQPASVCGGDQEEVSQHPVSPRSLLSWWGCAVRHTMSSFLTEESSVWWTMRRRRVILTEEAWRSTSTTGEDVTALKGENADSRGTRRPPPSSQHPTSLISPLLVLFSTGIKM